MDETILELLKLAKSIQEKHADDFSFVSLSALSSKQSFLITDSSASLDGIDENGICELGLEPILSKLQSDYQSEKDLLEILHKAGAKSYANEISSNALIHAISHEYSEQKYIAHIHSKTSNSMLCSKLGSKPFLGHIYEDSVTHCGKTVAFIPFAESGYFLAKTLGQELKNYKKQHFLSPKVLLMENHGHLVFGDNIESIINTIDTFEEWSVMLTKIFSFSSPNYLSHEQIINIEKNNREKTEFMLIKNRVSSSK